MRAFVIALVLALAAAFTLPAWAADEKRVRSTTRKTESGTKKVGKSKSGADAAKVKAATRRVEAGTKKVGKSKVGTSMPDTPRGVGYTGAAGTQFTGEPFKVAGPVPEAPKGAWQNLKEGNIKDSATAVGRSVKGFFTRLFN